MRSKTKHSRKGAGKKIVRNGPPARSGHVRPPASRGAVLARANRTGQSSYSVRNISADSVVVTGHDCLGELVGKTDSTGLPYISAVLLANPSSYAKTRLATMARGYTFYKPISWAVTYEPQVPATTPGSVVCGSVWADLQVDVTTPVQLVSTNGGRQGRVWNALQMRLDLTKLPQPRFRIDGHHAEDTPFRAIFTTSGLGNSANVPLGWLTLHYTYELSQPMVQPEFPVAIAGMPPGITVAPGVAGSPVRLAVQGPSSAAGKPLTLMTVAKDVLATNGLPLLKAGIQYFLEAAAAPAPMIGSTLSPANDTEYYTITDEYEGDPIVYTAAQEAAADVSAFFAQAGTPPPY